LRSIPLSIAFVFIVIALLGSSHADALQILRSPLIAIIMLLFIGTTPSITCGSACR
jgi:succinate dehydrogenase hydrophobic anchor subunit